VENSKDANLLVEKRDLIMAVVEKKVDSRLPEKVEDVSLSEEKSSRREAGGETAKKKTQSEGGDRTRLGRKMQSRPDAVSMERGKW